MGSRTVRYQHFGLDAKDILNLIFFSHSYHTSEGETRGGRITYQGVRHHYQRMDGILPVRLESYYAHQGA